MWGTSSKIQKIFHTHGLNRIVIHFTQDIVMDPSVTMSFPTFPIQPPTVNIAACHLTIVRTIHLAHCARVRNIQKKLKINDATAFFVPLRNVVFQHYVIVILDLVVPVEIVQTLMTVKKAAHPVILDIG
jgi:hypothetical protein